MDKRALVARWMLINVYLNPVKNIIIPVLGSRRKKMNGRSALKIGIRDLFSNSKAAEKKENSHFTFYLLAAKSYKVSCISLSFEEIKAS